MEGAVRSPGPSVPPTPPRTMDPKPEHFVGYMKPTMGKDSDPSHLANGTDLVVSNGEWERFGPLVACPCRNVAYLSYIANCLLLF